MVCVKGWPFTQTIPSDKPSLHTNHLLFSVLHPFTWTILSHKPIIILWNTYYLVCVKGYDKWFVWRDGLCEWMVCLNGRIVSGLFNYYLVCVKGWFVWLVSIPLHKPFIILCFTSLHTNHPFTQNIYHSLYYILSGFCKGMDTSHTVHAFKQTSLYVIKRKINGLFEGMDCAKGWFVWRDGLCEGIVCVKGWSVWLVSIPSQKPDNM